MENEVEWGRVMLVAMGEEDERGRGLCDSARSTTARMKRSWESRELRTGDIDRAWDDDESWTRRWESWPKVRLRVSEFVICEWESEIVWVRLKRIEMREASYVSWNEMRMRNRNFRVYNNIYIYIYIWGYLRNYKLYIIGSSRVRVQAGFL